jgi:hypothetical protein
MPVAHRFAKKVFLLFNLRSPPPPALNDVSAYLFSEPISPSAHAAYVEFSSLVMLAALYVLQIPNEQLHFIKRLLIGPHGACLFAAGTVVWLLTATASKPKLSSVIHVDVQLSTYKEAITTRI